MTNKCEHDFIKCGYAPESKEDEKIRPYILRSIATCIYCGQVRKVSSNGEVEIILVTGTVKWPQLNQPKPEA